MTGVAGPGLIVGAEGPATGDQAVGPGVVACGELPGWAGGAPVAAGPLLDSRGPATGAAAAESVGSAVTGCGTPVLSSNGATVDGVASVGRTGRSATSTSDTAPDRHR